MSLNLTMTVSANQSCVGRAMMLSLLCCPAGRHQYLYARSSCSSFPFPSGLRPHSRVVSNLDQSSDCCVDCKAAQPRSSEKNEASRAGQTLCTRW